MDDCYVYIYRDAAGVARYVGKGTGARMHKHLQLAAAINEGRERRATHFTRWLAKCIRTGTAFTSEVHAAGLSEERAWALEVKLIALFKRHRQPGGTLYNQTAGGDGFASEDVRELRRQRHMAKELLSDARVCTARVPPGRVETTLYDGGGLVLRVRNGADPSRPLRAWQFWYMTGGNRHRISLGPYPNVSLTAARAKAAQYAALELWADPVDLDELNSRKQTKDLQP